MAEIEASKILHDMRHVAEYPFEPNPCPKHELFYRALRRFLRDKPVAFMEKLAMLEAEFSREKAAYYEAGRRTDQQDQGEQAALEILDRFLHTVGK